MNPERKRGAGKDPVGKLAIAAVAIIVTFGVLAAFRTASKRPDPHFVAAEEMVSGYELGRERAARNYRHPVYGQALDRLDKVDPESISAIPAAELGARIEREIALAEKARKASRNKRAEATDARKARAEAMAARHRELQRRPPPTYPECDDDVSADHVDR